jgi:hypothetical protein
MATSAPKTTNARAQHRGVHIGKMEVNDSRIVRPVRTGIVPLTEEAFPVRLVEGAIDRARTLHGRVLDIGAQLESNANRLLSSADGCGSDGEEAGAPDTPSGDLPALHHALTQLERAVDALASQARRFNEA